MDCLFCKVVKREIPADIVFENAHAVAFRDIHPVAPTHVLIVPTKHIAGIHDATAADAELLAETLLATRAVAEKLGLDGQGYRLVINNGAGAGQSVFHLHVHLLAGRPLKWPPG